MIRYQINIDDLVISVNDLNNDSDLHVEKGVPKLIFLNARNGKAAWKSGNCLITGTRFSEEFTNLELDNYKGDPMGANKEAREGWKALLAWLDDNYGPGVWIDNNTTLENVPGSAYYMAEVEIAEILEIDKEREIKGPLEKKTYFSAITKLTPEEEKNRPSLAPEKAKEILDKHRAAWEEKRIRRASLTPEAAADAFLGPIQPDANELQMKPINMRKPPGRPHLPEDVWLWEQVNILGKEPTKDLYREWFEKMPPNRSEGYQDPERHFKRVIKAEWLKKKT